MALLKKRFSKIVVAKLLGIGLSGPSGFIVSYAIDYFYGYVEKFMTYATIYVTCKLGKKRGRELSRKMNRAVEESNYDNINQIGRDILNS